VYSPNRRSLVAAPHLCAELRASSSACAELDQILSLATAADPRQRPQSTTEFGELVLGLLERHGEVSLSA
jgi:hypothetical protein